MGLDPRTETYDEMIDTILGDAQCLWGMRWGMDFTKLTIDHNRYIHGNNLRFTAGNETIRAALGDLAEHVDFIRSTPNITPEDIVRYKECLKKWNVKDPTMTSSSGTDDKERPSTSTYRRFKPY